MPRMPPLGASTLSPCRSFDNQNNNIYTFCQYLPETTLQQSQPGNLFAGGVALSVLSPTLSLLDQVGSFTGIFDQYRISRVSISFRPFFQKANFTAGTDYVPLIYTVVDYDDGAAPGSLAYLREYQNCTIHEDDAFTVSFEPHVAVAAYGAGAFTSYSNVKSPWIDAVSTNVPHYGLKLGVTAGAAGQTHLQAWQISTQLCVQFRNVR